LNDALERQVPRYADINLMGSTAHRASEVLENGKRVSGRGRERYPPRDICSRPRRPSPRTTGRTPPWCRSDLDRILGTKSNDLVALRQQVMADGDWNRAKLAQVFGPDEADRVFRAVDRETAFRDAYNKVYQGSQTAQRLAGANAMGVRDVRPSAGDMSVPISTAAAGPAGGAMAVGMNMMRRGANALGRDADLARNAQFADFLVQTGPQRDATIQMLADVLGRRTGSRQAAETTDRLVQVLLGTEGRQEPVTDKAKQLARVLGPSR
jgi:hypothetical protein